MKHPYATDISLREHMRFYYLKFRTHTYLRSSRWARRRMKFGEPISAPLPETTIFGSLSGRKSNPPSSPAGSSSTTSASAEQKLTPTTKNSNWFARLPSLAEQAIRSMDDELFTKTISTVAVIALSVPLLVIGMRLFEHHRMLPAACVILPTLLNLAIAKVRR